ncbi:MAG: L-threonine 3-dehydrogenase [Armatimonadota bacterium]|nr:L-threonine 3-dehydrogenase [Armatimonadota bacterium]MDR7518939.1 L-threonine 3-dehydrogenase [Armatimonadota bacterium]
MPVPRRMRALVKARPSRGLEIADVPVPTPGRTDVLIRVAAGGICGTDLHIYRWDPWAASRIHPPRVVGHEFSGVVVEIGDDVTEVAVGDRVAGESHIACGWCGRCRHGQAHICERLEIVGVDRDGAFAEYVVLPARNAWRLDDAIPLDIGAIMDPLGNAVHTALATELVTRTVAITGCGPIGLMAIPVCRAAGAALIIATDVRPGRLALAARMGADVVVDARGGGAADRIRAATDGQGVDAVLEMSGHPDGIRDALQAVRSGGWVGLLGLPPGPVELDLANRVICKAVRVEGIFGRRLWQTWEQMTTLLRRGLDVRPVITHRCSLECFEEAFTLLESGEAGKVILTVEP